MSLSLLAVTTVLMVAPSAAAPRGNTVLARETRRAVYSLTAAARFGVLVGNGRRVIQPYGFGFGLQFRYHGLRVGPTRFGLELHAGHTRFMERRDVVTTAADGGEQSARRWAALGHTDFTLGPSLQVPLRPLVLEIGAGAGLMVSDLVRPHGVRVAEEEQVTDASAMLRAGGQLGVPIRNNQGIVAGAAVQQIFSRTQVVANPDPAQPDLQPDTSVFDLVVESYLAYQMWF